MRKRRGGLRRFARHQAGLLGAVFLLAVGLAALFAPRVSPYLPETIDLRQRLSGPGPGHWLGTNQYGRDLLSRLPHGSRVSLLVGLGTALLTVGLGTLLGAAAGFRGGGADMVIMRLADAFLSIAIFFFLLISLAVFGATVPNIIVTLALASWMPSARVVRGEILRVKGMEFVAGARAVGGSELRILFRHMLPHSLPAMIVATALAVANAILVESSLSYLGLGVQPPIPSWGNMLSDAQKYLWESPLMAAVPGIPIFCTVLACNWLGDALRHATDPQQGDLRRVSE